MRALEMNPEIRARWVAALRSGEIPQARLSLNDGNGGRCCLGVLADLAVEAGVIPPPAEAASGRWLYGTDDDADGYCLPDAVVKWAGLSNYSPQGPGGEGRLTELNDGSGRAEGTPWTFGEIADLIEGGEPDE